MANAGLRSIISNQSKQLEEVEQARIRDKEEMNKKYANLEAKLELLLGNNSQSLVTCYAIFGWNQTCVVAAHLL